MLRDDGVRGGVNFIQKPFRPDALANRLRRLLDG
jgi:DNA-binding response OmpR family regulator